MHDVSASPFSPPSFGVAIVETTNPNSLFAEYTKMMEQLRKDMPVIYLYHPINIVGMQAKLSGFRPVPDGMIRLQGLAASK